MSSVQVQALQRALAAEQAIVWGYGVAGAHLTGDDQALATEVWHAHQARRDQLMALLQAAGAVPTAPPASYQLPFRVGDAAAARRLIGHLEDSGAGAAWDLVSVGAPDSPMRSAGITWLAASAVTVARLVGAVPPALPGSP